MGPQNEVSTSIRCGDGERLLAESADRADVPDETDERRVSRCGGSALLLPVPDETLRSMVACSCSRRRPSPASQLTLRRPMALGPGALRPAYGMVSSSADERRSTSAAPSRKLDDRWPESRPKSSRSGVESPLSFCDGLLACSTSMRGVVGVWAVDVEALASEIGCSSQISGIGR